LVIERTKVFNITYRPIESLIVIVGETKPTEKAVILITFVIEHQIELSHIENENAKISKSIEVKKQRIKSDAVEEVLVPKELLGLIIGKGGANLSYVKNEYGVGIHIIEYNDEENREYTETEIPEDKALIRIFGKDPEWVSQAKKVIYLQRVNIPIEFDKIDYTRGYQNSIINDIKEKSGCVKVFMHDPETKSSTEGILEVIGNEDSIESLKMLLQTHLEYFNSYQEKDQTSRDLSKQMNKINSNYGDAYYGGEGHKSQGNPNAKRRNKKY